MTKPSAERRCGWCRRVLEARSGPGRPQVFCRQACRQAAYVAGRRRDELGLSETELVIARRELDDLRDKLYVLEAAIEDVERDLTEAEGEEDVRQALAWILDAARPLIATADFT
ncbi:MAG: hypothetical protein ACJ739_04785 [Acidimicrobiales bacterium]